VVTNRYLDPESRYTAAFAPSWRRGGAAAIDWGLCIVGYLLASIPLGVVQAVGRTSSEEGDLGGIPGDAVATAAQILTLAPVVAYFALLLPKSQTFGMRVLELHMISLSTGRGPAATTAAVRAVIAALLGTGVYVVNLLWTSYDSPRQLDTASRYAVIAAYVLAGAAATSALIMILTHTHRSLIDRLFGMAVVHELQAIAPQMGPWGPLDAFDLSNKKQAVISREIR
jgi:hypothetical protein